MNVCVFKSDKYNLYHENMNILVIAKGHILFVKSILGIPCTTIYIDKYMANKIFECGLRITTLDLEYVHMLE